MRRRTICNNYPLKEMPVRISQLQVQNVWVSKHFENCFDVFIKILSICQRDLASDWMAIHGAGDPVTFLNTIRNHLYDGEIIFDMLLTDQELSEKPSFSNVVLTLRSFLQYLRSM